MCFGGSRWREEQAEVLDFAEKLHYDHSSGGSLIPETDDKGAWVDWRDDFGRWKDKNVALEDSGQAFWQTYEAPSESPSDGGGGERSFTNPGSGIGPYPADNMYFPQLTHAYETPQAQDWSQYGLIDPAYQPWTVQGGQQFVPENIWNYAPPQINRGPVQHMNSLFGPMEVIRPEEEGGNGDDYGPYSDDRGSDGTGIRTGWITGADGKGYATDKHGMVIGSSGYPSVDLTAEHNPQQNIGTTISNAIAGLLGQEVATATQMGYTSADLLGTGKGAGSLKGFAGKQGWRE